MARKTKQADTPQVEPAPAVTFTRLQHNLKLATESWDMDLFRDITVLVGPPATGKTASVMAIIFALTGCIPAPFLKNAGALVKDPGYIASLAGQGCSRLFAKLECSDGQVFEASLDILGEKSGRVQRRVPSWAPAPGSDLELRQVPTLYALQLLAGTVAEARRAFLSRFLPVQSIVAVRARILRDLDVDDKEEGVVERGATATREDFLLSELAVLLESLPAEGYDLYDQITERSTRRVKALNEDLSSIDKALEALGTVEVLSTNVEAVLEEQVASLRHAALFADLASQKLCVENLEKDVTDAQDTLEGIRKATPQDNEIDGLEAVHTAVVFLNGTALQQNLDFCLACGRDITADKLLEGVQAASSELQALSKSTKRRTMLRASYDAATSRLRRATEDLMLAREWLAQLEEGVRSLGMDPAKPPAAPDVDVTALVRRLDGSRNFRRLNGARLHGNSMLDAAKTVGTVVKHLHVMSFGVCVKSFEETVLSFLPTAWRKDGWKVRLLLAYGGREVFMVGLQKGDNAPTLLSLGGNENVQLLYALGLALGIPASSRAAICLPVIDYATTEETLGAWLGGLKGQVGGTAPQVYITSTVQPDMRYLRGDDELKAQIYQITG